MARLSAVLLLVLAFTAGVLPGIHPQEAHGSTEGLQLQNSVSETEAQCPKGLYRGGPFCCLPCQPGERKHMDCTAYGHKAICKPCQEGEEYTDKEHYSSKCRRCRLCDGEHGFEVKTNCTRTQNTKCQCKPSFYCNASVCEHCEPCTTCEHGTLELCTPTRNTKCKTESTRSNLHFLWLLLLLIILAPLAALKYKMKRKKKNHPPGSVENLEKVPMNLSDIDLSRYITTIAEKMEINQVVKFARKTGMEEAKIDEIKNDHLRDTAEQKQQLLRSWYQSHGKKDAYHAFIDGLRKAKLHALAEKIQDIIQTDYGNTTSNFRNENERQSLA